MGAGMSAIPFAIAGETAMAALGVATLLLAVGTCLIGIGVLWGRRWARRTAMILEAFCLAGSLLLLALPVGANHGLVAWMVNVGLPIALLVVLRKSAARDPALT
jgi:hypothetical protein